MRTIYTTESIKIEGIEVLGIDRLSPKTRLWVVSNRRNLLRTATLPEKMAARMFGKFYDVPTRQAFFMIRRRCYYLDFFFPKLMVAVEIDGSVHKLQKAHDRRRDADFRSIGIRTIRIKNEDVMSGKLYEKLFEKIYKK